MGSAAQGLRDGRPPGGTGTLVEPDAVICATLLAMALRQRVQSGFLVLKASE